MTIQNGDDGPGQEAGLVVTTIQDADDGPGQEAGLVVTTIQYADRKLMVDVSLPFPCRQAGEAQLSKGAQRQEVGVFHAADAKLILFRGLDKKSSGVA